MWASSVIHSEWQEIHFLFCTRVEAKCSKFSLLCLFFFFSFSPTLMLVPSLLFRFDKPSHYFSFFFESHLHSEFKGSYNWLIGKYDYFCNYINTYSKLMWLLAQWINKVKLEHLSLWLHYAVMGQVLAQTLGYWRFAILLRQLLASHLVYFD